jgi:hypothetical protein
MPLIMWLAGIGELENSGPSSFDSLMHKIVSSAGGIGLVYTVAVPSASKSISTSVWTLISSGATCASNFWAVGMIAYRYQCVVCSRVPMRFLIIRTVSTKGK